ncbi:hypothetical protein GEMRC1_000412 [Eukaryota sp. GEM-RC1]
MVKDPTCFLLSNIELCVELRSASRISTSGCLSAVLNGYNSHLFLIGYEGLYKFSIPISYVTVQPDEYKISFSNGPISSVTLQGSLYNSLKDFQSDILPHLSSSNYHSFDISPSELEKLYVMHTWSKSTTHFHTSSCWGSHEYSIIGQSDSDIVSQLFHSRQHQLLTDKVIVFHGQSYPCHSSFLSSFSPVLKEKLLSSDPEVNFPHLGSLVPDADLFFQILDYCYGQLFQLTFDNVGFVLTLCSALRLSALVDAIHQVMSEGC